MSIRYTGRGDPGGDVNRRPTAIALKGFLLLATTPVALGLVPLPGSLEAGPGVFGQTAAVTAWLGCLVSLIGLLWRGRLSTSLYIEQAGLTMISVGYALYAVALFTVPKFPDALMAFGLSGGLACAGAVQNWFISRYRKERREVLDGR